MLEQAEEGGDEPDRYRGLGADSKAKHQSQASDQRPADAVERVEIERPPDVHALGAVMHLVKPAPQKSDIMHALFLAVQPNVKLGEPVTAIRRESGGVRIEHKSGATRADFAVVTLPAHLLERVPNDFSPAKKAALKGINYLKSAKVAFEAPRFWEDDGVYGGLAW